MMRQIWSCRTVQRQIADVVTSSCNGAPVLFIGGRQNTRHAFIYALASQHIIDALSLMYDVCEHVSFVWTCMIYVNMCVNIDDVCEQVCCVWTYMRCVWTCMMCVNVLCERVASAGRWRVWGGGGDASSSLHHGVRPRAKPAGVWSERGDVPGRSDECHQRLWGDRAARWQPRSGHLLWRVHQVNVPPVTISIQPSFNFVIKSPTLS